MARPPPDAGRSGPPGGPDFSRRWAIGRDLHLRQVTSFGFFTPSRPKRSVTTRPAPLRYVEHVPAARTMRILLLVGAPAYAAWRIWQGSELWSALGLAALFAGIILIASTYRLTVSNSGISLDIAGLRQVSSFGFVALHAVRDVSVGPVPATWPKARLKGGWWPGRRRVNVWHLDATGSQKCFSVWVSDPDAFATAVLGQPLSGRD